MTNKPSWQTEYNNIFGIKHYQVCVGKKCSCHKEVKAFIQDLLDRKVKKIEDTVAGFSSNGIDDVDHSEYFKGYNEAKKQALSILKEE